MFSISIAKFAAIAETPALLDPSNYAMVLVKFSSKAYDRRNLQLGARSRTHIYLTIEDAYF